MSKFQGQRGDPGRSAGGVVLGRGALYRAARARLGTDTAFDPGVFKVGKRLAMKVCNAQPVRPHAGSEACGRRSPGRRMISASHSSLALVARLRVGDRHSGTRAFEAFGYGNSHLQVVGGRLLALLRPLSGARQAALRSPTRTPPDGGRRWRRSASASTPTSACSRRSCPLSPKRRGRGSSPGSGRMQSVHTVAVADARPSSMPCRNRRRRQASRPRWR